MLKLTSPSQLFRVPPTYRPPVTNALQNLGPDPSGRGFVVFVEENDTLMEINIACFRDISTSFEGTFIDGNSLIGVVLWVNSSDGVTVVRPDQKGYAEKITDVLQKTCL